MIHGVGIVGGGDASIGVLAVGATTRGSPGTGYFRSQNYGGSVGLSTTYGATANFAWRRRARE